ncbi:Uncharacterized protein TCM_038624 [Theobroma cacao]|uniref:Uncharacterized protein n=1 Tax=Theobroma cacao TaxID=3641 RepID=A0A061GQ57_THECC|nr:Uncharacterized protein TCM_038624 [Theobroma cacao]
MGIRLIDFIILHPFLYFSFHLKTKILKYVSPLSPNNQLKKQRIIGAKGRVHTEEGCAYKTHHFGLTIDPLIHSIQKIKGLQLLGH